MYLPLLKETIGVKVVLLIKLSGKNLAGVKKQRLTFIQMACIRVWSFTAAR